jgi:hypothetical protein
MNQFVNQHYVPQSYLKNFSIERSQISVFDKFEKRSFTSNVRNVASERAFYDFPQSVSQPENIKVIENLFSGLETRQDRFLRHIQKKVDCIFGLRRIPDHAGKIYSIDAITADQRQDLACVVAIQLLRTKEFRKFIVEMRQAVEHLTKQTLEQAILDRIEQFELVTATKLNEELASGLQSLILDECNSTVSVIYDEGLAVVHAKFILEHYSEVAQILSDHIWIIGVNDTGQPLFTSDHPVVRHSCLSSTGIASEGVEISFPLNSTAILIMREKRYFREFTKQDSKLFPLTLEDVEHYNRLQIYNSNRFVFCSVDCFELVQLICQHEPEICSEDRRIIQIKTSEVQSDETGG